MPAQAMAVDLSRLNMELSAHRNLHSYSQDKSLCTPRQPVFAPTVPAGCISNEEQAPAQGLRSSIEQCAASSQKPVSSNLADGPKHIPWRASVVPHSTEAAAAPVLAQPFAARIITPERRACSRIHSSRAPPSPNDPELCTNLRKSALLRSMLSRSEDHDRPAATSPRHSRFQSLAAPALAPAASLDSDAMSMSQRSTSMSLSYDMDHGDQDDEVQS